MEITSAEFVISNTDVKKCPAGIFPEYAFIGRSNVGKSSLINKLTARKVLAMTSATPGKTMLINHFLINKNWYLVDLPGYGYARRGQKGKDQIRTIIEDYILEREQMTNLFVLIDSRLEPQNIDLEFMEWLGENGIPFSIIFTKADKLKGGRLKMNVNAYLRELSKQWEELPPYFISSSENRTGRTEIHGSHAVRYLYGQRVQQYPGSTVPSVDAFAGIRSHGPGNVHRRKENHQIRGHGYGTAGEIPGLFRGYRGSCLSSRIFHFWYSRQYHTYKNHSHHGCGSGETSVGH